MDYVGMLSFPLTAFYSKQSAFTIERPFGIHLWSVLDICYTKIVGYSATEFRFTPHQSPFSTAKSTFISILIYYVIILGGREMMRNRAPFKLHLLFLTHNLCLTIISTLLLALYIEQVLPIIVRDGLFKATCHIDGGWTQPLEVIHFLNYLTKYVELLDTVFLMLRKKELTFLHCYHHGATVILAFEGMISTPPSGWIIACLNLSVHIMMYWYYFQAARGLRVRWKKWVTRVQIFQFIIDLGVICFAYYNDFISRYFPWSPNSSGGCTGNPKTYFVFIGPCVMVSYLILFIDFYLVTYKMDKTVIARSKHIRNLSQGKIVDIAQHQLLTKRAIYNAEGN